MRTSILSLLCLFLAAAFPACSDEEPTPGTLRGTVTDAMGLPVAGAYINLDYGYELVEIAEAVPTGADAASATDGLIEIFTHWGEAVRTVELDPESTIFAWDGRDDDGRPVPSDVYLYRLSTFAEGTEDVDQTFERWMFLVASSRDETWVARTDDEGLFAIPLDHLPLWKDFDMTATEGEDLRKVVLDGTVTVHANPEGATWPADQTVLTVTSQYRDITVDLKWPEGP